MMFRELANCPFKAHPASTDPSLCDSKTKECGKASKGIDKEFLIKKKNKNKTARGKHSGFPDAVFVLHLSTESTHFIGSLLLSSAKLLILHQERRARSHLSSEMAHILWKLFLSGPLSFSEMVCTLSVECLSLKDPLAFWDSLHPIKCLSLSASLGFWDVPHSVECFLSKPL